MKVGQYAVDGAAKLILDNQFWYDVKMFVSDASGRTELTGEEKKAKVKQDLLIVFGDIGEVVMNLGIELAVTWLKSQQK